MVDRTHGETKLWESFIKGETAAFEEVYRRYYSLLYSYGIRMVGDRELVADTIQNLFVKFISKRTKQIRFYIISIMQIPTI